MRTMRRSTAACSVAHRAQGHAKPDRIVESARGAAGAGCGTADFRARPPAAATCNPVITAARPLGIGHGVFGIGPVPVAAPFEHVTAHVEKTPSIRLFR